jgi:hypothetical protein
MSDPEHDHSSTFPTSGSSKQSSKPEQQRRIGHLDLNAFYASAEQRDNPELGRRDSNVRYKLLIKGFHSRNKALARSAKVLRYSMAVICLRRLIRVIRALIDCEFKVQGRGADDALRMLEDAVACRRKATLLLCWRVSPLGSWLGSPRS